MLEAANFGQNVTVLKRATETPMLTAWASAPAPLSSARVWPCRLSSDVIEIKLVFSIPPHRATPNIWTKRRHPDLDVTD